ncbi:hypothetical protein CRYUN_Cryun13aG0000200 [Craigia yunnanensis]
MMIEYGSMRRKNRNLSTKRGRGKLEQDKVALEKNLVYKNPKQDTCFLLEGMSRDTTGPNQSVQVENCGSSHMTPCNQENESTIHALWSYSLAKEVWQKSYVSTYWSQQDDKCMLNWISKNSANMEDKPFKLGLIIMWSIWNSRNAKVKNGEDRTPQGTWEFEVKYYQELSHL